jgi:chemotaxis protein MotB
MRKRRHEEEENQERWLVSYADFITLLFAFFVVMYAISSVNEGKYRVLSETLTDAFQDKRLTDRGTPVGVESGGALIARPEVVVNVEEDNPLQTGSVEPIPPVDTTRQTPEVVQQPQEQPQQQGSVDPAAQQLVDIAAQLDEKLADFIGQGIASVVYDERWVEVNLDSKILFESAASRLNREALRALREVSKVLRGQPNEINVEGHTDNVPIRTREYPSNWELSAARAASVVHYLARLGMDPERMAAVGFGEYRGKGDNTTEEGRAANRRVTLLIMAVNNSANRRGAMRSTLEEPLP